MFAFLLPVEATAAAVVDGNLAFKYEIGLLLFMMILLMFILVW
jgi:hypothetical protein